MISIIFYLDGKDRGVDPFGESGMGGEDEQRYYRHGVAGLAAFSNVMWDIANEYRSFRDDAWAEKMGTLIKGCDPNHHLTSTHGHADFRFRTSPWADFAMYQSWDEGGGHGFMFGNRGQQAATGRAMPQINEEYGYNMNLHVVKTPREEKHWDVQHTWIAPWRLADDYHVYGLQWDKDEINWFVDGVLVRSVENTHWHQPLYLTFDSQTMPLWFGMPKDEDLPSTFSIEYVRAWKKTAQ